MTPRKEAPGVELLSAEERVQELLSTNPDKRAETVEFGKALFAAIKRMEEEIKAGDGIKVEDTIGETFRRNEIKELTRKGYFYFIPQSERGRLICLSDCHGCKEAFEAALKEFIARQDSYLVVTGDLVSAFGEHEYEMIKAMLKLKADPETSKRVVWLRGNCETHVWPMEVTEENTLYERLGFKPDVVLRHRGLEPLFRELLPVAAVSENGGFFVHGTPQNASLMEVNGCADYDPETAGAFGNEGDGSRLIFRMLEGDIGGDVAPRAEIVSQTLDAVAANLDTVGAEFLVRGHQKKRLAKLGGGSSCMVEESRGKQIATIHSGRFQKSGGDTYLSLPNQSFAKIEQEMIKKVV